VSSPLFPAASAAGGSSIPDTIVGISFDDAFRAQEFLTASFRLASTGTIELRDAVTIVKDDEGKTVVRETIDPQPLRSALSGSVWAGLVGLLLAGPVGWIAGAALGAGTGAVSAKIVDLGIPDEWVTWFRDAVRPGTATVVLLLGAFDNATTFAELERFSGGRLVYASLGEAGMDRIRRALGEASPGDAPAAPQAAAPGDAG